MNYFKLLPKIEITRQGKRHEYQQSLEFTFPPRTVFDREVNGIKHNPDTNTKPVLECAFKPSVLSETGENKYSISNNKSVYVATNQPQEDWIGTTFKFRVVNNMGCQGSYYISFELQAIPSEQDFYNQI